jgi:hypothetical protein
VLTSRGLPDGAGFDQTGAGYVPHHDWYS